MQVVDNLHMEWHGVEGPGFLRFEKLFVFNIEYNQCGLLRTGDEPEMIDKLAEAVSGSHILSIAMPKI